MPCAPITVAALYRFTPFDDPAALKPALLECCRANNVKGTLLLAGEGINGTIAGTRDALDAVLDHIRTLPGCAGLEVKFSSATAMPFLRMKVRLKREIVTMGEPDLDPAAHAGQYVAPEDWNALITDPDTIVIDTRNDYEVGTGSFRGAINPATGSFSEFPDWFRANRERLLGTDGPKRVAMFCTGGIRCEKSTAFLRREGVEEVYHLEGGILKYLETQPEEASLWDGECFVFDQRVTVGHGLRPSTHTLCHACRMPVAPEGLASPHYEEGVSCPACHESRSDEQRAGYRTRQEQEMLARQRGTRHLGAELSDD